MPAADPRLRRVGVVVHPSRDIDEPLDRLLRWAREHGADVVQVTVPGQDRTVAEAADAGVCDLLVSIGGDGTMLAAIRAAVGAERPVIGVSCGSLGALTTVSAEDLGDALDRVARGAWTERRLPVLDIFRDGAPDLFAVNDLGVLRAGIGQVRVTTTVDGCLYARLAGDGCIVSTPVGSSAYSLAAGGPLLAADAAAFLLTPLATHGGSRQPLVVAAGSELSLEVRAGFGGSRLEVDGQVVADDVGSLRIRLRPDVARLVRFSERESMFDSLRRRGIISDSPRISSEGA